MTPLDRWHELAERENAAMRARLEDNTVDRLGLAPPAHILRRQERKKQDRVATAKDRYGHVLAVFQPGHDYLAREIAEQLDTTAQAVSSSLRFLEKAGLIEGRKELFSDLGSKSQLLTVWRLVE